MAKLTIMKCFTEQGTHTRLFRGNPELYVAFPQAGAVKAAPQDIANYPIIDTGELMRVRTLIPFNVHGYDSRKRVRTLRILVSALKFDDFQNDVGIRKPVYNGVTYYNSTPDSRRYILT